MVKERICKKCKRFVLEGEAICPVCKGNQFTNIFKGRINILDANKSSVAQKIEIKEKGRYAIKIN